MLRCGISVAILDGDAIRDGLSEGLGFSSAGRRENIRRIAEVAHLLSSQGLTVIAAAISPSSSHRQLARRIIGPAYREVYVKASLAACEERDVKGMYARARRGEIAQFTGVTDAYEAPLHPDLLIDTSRSGVGEAVDSLMPLIARHRLNGEIAGKQFA
jgi:adenylyl-sulfate kinase